MYFEAGEGLEPPKVFWTLPAYETGEIPTSLPRNIYKNYVCFDNAKI